MNVTDLYLRNFDFADIPSDQEIPRFINDIRVRLDELATLADFASNPQVHEGNFDRIETLTNSMIAILHATLNTTDRLEEMFGEMMSQAEPASRDGKTLVPKSQIDRCVAFAEGLRTRDRRFARPEAN